MADEGLHHAIRCPRCNSEKVVRNGRRASRQRYRCQDCGSNFTGVTGTPAAGVKAEHLPKFDRVVNAVLLLGIPPREVAADQGVPLSTIYRWKKQAAADPVWIAREQQELENDQLLSELIDRAMSLGIIRDSAFVDVVKNPRKHRNRRSVLFHQFLPLVDAAIRLLNNEEP